MEGPLRCPACGALVVDRRHAKCTTCHAELPADFLFTPRQAEELAVNDQHARAEHAAAIEEMDQTHDPDGGSNLTIDVEPD